MPTMAVDWLGIRNALRVRRAELHMELQELVRKSGIGRTTIYRIENVTDIPDHVMDLETVEAIARAMGLSLSELFLRVEGATLSVTRPDQGSRASEGGSDVPASPDERDRVSRLEADVNALKTQFGNVQTLARSIVREVFIATRQSRAPGNRQSKRRRVHRKAS
jgi:transcriptional regulator with XRE-family HTH domain